MKFAIFGNTSTTASADSRAAKAYCAGWGHQVGLGLIGDVPFAANIEGENKTAWEAGFNDALAGSIPLNATHCALPAFKTVPNIVGLTQVAADLAIIAAGLTVGGKTNTNDPVTAQATAAETKVNEAFALAYTLTV